MADIKFIFDHVPVKKFRRLNFKNSVREVATVIHYDERIPAKQINLRFADDKVVREHNAKYLGHDYNTDIITFDYGEEGSDILISTDTVFMNSKKYNVSFEIELMRVVIHGLLHIAGFKDKTATQKKIMRSKEDHYLSLIETYHT